jgi:hypothetical protein
VPTDTKIGYVSRSLRWILGFVALTSLLFYSTRAEAAEKVVLKYRFLQEKVSVPELATFAQTGELSSSLRSYLKLANKKPDDLRRTLTQEVKVNPTFLYRALNNPLGEGMLDQVSQVIHTPTNRANRESLRGALVSSALPDGNITLIETLQNYPTPEVHVEGDRIAEVMQNIRNWLNRLPRLGS